MTATLPTDTTWTAGTISGLTTVESKVPVKPTGYHVLIGLPPINEKARAGSMLYAPQDRAEIDSRRSITVEVISIGAECYTDKDRYPLGPWCKVGDWVMIPTHAGSAAFKIRGGDREYRIINEDTVLSVVEKPDEVERV